MAGLIKGRTDIPDIEDLEFIDICPLAIGREMAGGRMAVLIPAGSRLPASGSERFYPALHDSTSLRISAFEGSWLMTSRNRLLGSFCIDLIPDRDAREEQAVSVKFDLSPDGILTATAVPLSGEATQSLTVRKVGCLIGRERSNQTAAERKSEQETDKQEYDEAGRRAAIESLATNLETFFREQTLRNPGFVHMVGRLARRDLLAIVRDQLPVNTGWVTSADEVRGVFHEVGCQLSFFFNHGTMEFPPWLQWGPDK
jgi:molecular chaperone DnaK (HSP70)